MKPISKIFIVCHEKSQFRDGYWELMSSEIIQCFDNRDVAVGYAQALSPNFAKFSQSAITWVEPDVSGIMNKLTLIERSVLTGDANTFK